MIFTGRESRRLVYSAISAGVAMCGCIALAVYPGRCWPVNAAGFAGFVGVWVWIIHRKDKQ